MTSPADLPLPEPVVVADPEMLAPKGQRFLLSEDMMPLDPATGRPVPFLRVSEVAKVFFGRSDDWLRWRMKPSQHRIKGANGKINTIPGDFPKGYFILDGQPLHFRKTESGNRYFSLADIELMAHALLETRAIDGAHAIRTLTIVKNCAQMYGILP